MEECEKAFDAGLLLAALNLVVTIPDVCANIDGTDYRDRRKAPGFIYGDIRR